MLSGPAWDSRSSGTSCFSTEHRVVSDLVVVVVVLVAVVVVVVPPPLCVDGGAPSELMLGNWCWWRWRWEPADKEHT